MAREGGEEDSVLQLLEARICYCRVPEYKEQTNYIQEALQNEGFERNMRFGERFEEEVDTTNMYFMANENTPKKHTKAPRRRKQ